MRTILNREDTDMIEDMTEDTALEIAAKLSTGKFAEIESPLVLDIVEATLVEVRGGTEDRDGWSENPDADELLERAWGIIANAPWSDEADEWTRAAIGFRTAYFARLPEVIPSDDVPRETS